MWSNLRIRYPHINQFLLYAAKCLGLVLAVGAVIAIVVHLVGNGGDYENSDPAQGPLSGHEWQEMRQKRYNAYQRRQGSMSGRGEQGDSVALSKAEKTKAASLFDKEGMNIVASDVIALDRSLMDYRSDSCKKFDFKSVKLGTASVIIIYHNEAWSPVLRTVHSVINRSPPAYLREVILMDDASTRPELLEPLDKYIAKTWPDGVVRKVVSSERLGLIKARQVGAEHATGDVIVFLDAHCEAGVGWLEPILHRIATKRNSVVCPHISSISADTMYFAGGGRSRAVGGFSWAMHFTWDYKPDNGLPDTEPLPSPTMAGGLFASDRKYFFELGGYDTGMEIWGGENLELSFRVWMCGGSLDFLPCSHVGHIFRATHPYGFPDKKRDYHGINTLRMVRVWLDDYQRLYYYHRPDLKEKETGDIESRHLIRKNLQCHTFQWYLDNVYKDKFILDRNIQFWGQLSNAQSRMCLDTMAVDEHSSYRLGLFGCQIGTNQMFSLSNSHKLRREFQCAGKSNLVEGVMMETCSFDDGDETRNWYYDKKTSLMHYGKGGSKCLGQCDGDKGKYACFVDCNANDILQEWKWKSMSLA